MIMHQWNIYSAVTYLADKVL